MNTAPKYGKVELKIRQPNSSIIVTEFKDCGFFITGDYIVIVEDKRDELKTTQTSTGNIFNLKDIISYKTHKS